MSGQISKNSEWDPLVFGEQQLVATVFWAPLCPCCGASKPVFESMIPKDQDTKFVRVYVDQIPDIASKKYGTQGVPAVKFFCESKEVREVAGYTPKDNFRKDIKKMVVRSAPRRLTNLSSAEPSASNTISMLNGGETE
jgi:thioredoxin-like negative regulator of GroEL